MDDDGHPAVYRFGIIDMLQTYDFGKVCGHCCDLRLFVSGAGKLLQDQDSTAQRGGGVGDQFRPLCAAVPAHTVHEDHLIALLVNPKQ